jgi:hypothetical protein
LADPRRRRLLRSVRLPPLLARFFAGGGGVFVFGPAVRQPKQSAAFAGPARFFHLPQHAALFGVVDSCFILFFFFLGTFFFGRRQRHSF